MDNRCIVVALIRPLPGKAAEVRGHLEAVIPEVHLESGCEFYALHQSTDDTLVFIEAWDTREQWLEHTDGPAVADINKRLDGLLASAPEVHECHPALAGDMTMGRLPRND